MLPVSELYGLVSSVVFYSMVNGLKEFSSLLVELFSVGLFF